MQLIISKKYVLHKVYSNRNVYKTRLWQRWHQRLVKMKSCISPRSNGALFTNAVLKGTIQNIITVNKGGKEL